MARGQLSSTMVGAGKSAAISAALLGLVIQQTGCTRAFDEGAAEQQFQEIRCEAVQEETTDPRCWLKQPPTRALKDACFKVVLKNDKCRSEEQLRLAVRLALAGLREATATSAVVLGGKCEQGYTEILATVCGDPSQPPDPTPSPEPTPSPKPTPGPESLPDERDPQAASCEAPVELTPAGSSPELHVVGIYESRSDHSGNDYHPRGETVVEVTRPGPADLVLSSYEPTAWVVRAVGTAEIRTVILSGYYRQTATVPAGARVVSYSYEQGSPNFGTFCPEATYPFRWPSSSSECLVRTAERMLEHRATTFRGCYRAQRVVIAEPAPVLPPAGSAPATWNPADAQKNIVLSSDQLGASVPSEVDSVNDSVRATVGHRAGKHYWELKVDRLGDGGYQGIGVATQHLSLELGPETDGYGGCAYDPSGMVRCAGRVVATDYEPFAVGDVIGVAVDLDRRAISFSRNGRWQGGAQPEWGKDGLSLRGDAAYLLDSRVVAELAFFPVLNLSRGDLARANFGATPFAGQVPAGFMPGWLAQP
ncbi:MAG: hypothetical protein IPG96_06540 [Proteobacteria bacterium]|nr:hypothetical protein [Pseudomonadota bacterium]